MKFIVNGTELPKRLKELNIDVKIKRVDYIVQDIINKQNVRILEIDSLERLMYIVGSNDLKIRNLDMFEYPLIEVE